ncbi:hypothetical protein NDU88_004331 [Pleurodeles waltl]|uniref:Uncharacterized protein n=1 Tax=Pleurodeles waltl TaxID=8319 RepID=A0AAV7WUS5_PLEWA|nr:hypothetical protein NDU88_004331 [Pleurodeles waltl]
MLGHLDLRYGPRREFPPQRTSTAPARGQLQPGPHHGGGTPHPNSDFGGSRLLPPPLRSSTGLSASAAAAIRASLHPPLQLSPGVSSSKGRQEGFSVTGGVMILPLTGSRTPPPSPGSSRRPSLGCSSRSSQVHTAHSIPRSQAHPRQERTPPQPKRAPATI